MISLFITKRESLKAGLHPNQSRTLCFVCEPLSLTILGSRYKIEEVHGLNNLLSIILRKKNEITWWNLDIFDSSGRFSFPSSVPMALDCHFAAAAARTFCAKSVCGSGHNFITLRDGIIAPNFLKHYFRFWVLDVLVVFKHQRTIWE